MSRTPIVPVAPLPLAFLPLALTFCLSVGLTAPPSAHAACGDGTLDFGEQCDDGNTDPGDCCSSTCAYEAIDSPCEHPGICFAGGQCDDGECINGVAVDCDDGDSCTVDRCDEDAGGCTSTGTPGCCTTDADCDDSVVCNGFEFCQFGGPGRAGTCQDGTPITCDDGDDCTRDACVPASGGCTATPDEGLPGCAEDVDDDGQWDRLDLCPDTPAGDVAVLDGCSNYDLGERPEILIQESDEAYSALLTTFLAPDDRRRESKSVVRIRKTIEKAAYQLAGGAACRSSRMFARAERLNDKLLAGVSRLETNARAVAALAAREAAGGHRGTLGQLDSDHRPVDLDVIYYNTLLERLQDASMGFIRASDIVETICDGSERLRTTGIIEAVEAGGSRLRLTDGSRVRISNARIKGLPMPGARVRVRGERWGINDSVAKIVVSEARVDPSFAFDPRDCIEIKIAPVQSQSGLDSNPVLLGFDGYRIEGIGTDGTHFLENGMALYVENKGCIFQQVDGNGRYWRYAVDFQATTKTFFSKSKVTEFASDIGPDEYWLFPWTLNGQGTLEMTWHRRQCDTNNLSPCGSASLATLETLITEEIDISVTSRGGYCQTNYDKTEFSVEDLPHYYDGWSASWLPTSYDDFDEADVIGTSGWNIVMGGTSQWQGYVYEVLSPGVSSYPTLNLINHNTNFAIYATRDPYWNESGYQGVSTPSGVAWPHVVGVRNNDLYRYACTVPPIIRDLVDECTGVDSYYRLPYYGNVKCGQGNNTEFTHCGDGYPGACGQKYAFDFSIAQNYPVVAARGGTVVRVQSDAFNSCSDKNVCTEEQFYCCVNSPGGGICAAGDPTKIGNYCNADAECDSEPFGGDGWCGCVANEVAIEHADGSVALYYHMKQNGVNVQEGDRVYRGDNIGSTGNTGCSTGPHLHFHVIGKWGGSSPWERATQPVRFETAAGQCVVPVTNSTSQSTNVGWYNLP